MKPVHPGGQKRTTMTAPFLQRTLDVLTVIGLLGFVIIGAVLGAAWAGVWAGWQAALQNRQQGRQGIWVKTCPFTRESALLLLENERVMECSLGGSGCGALCQQKTTTVRSGIFYTSKLLNLNYKADSANFGC